ncbi:MAG: hypothetical protein ACR2QJ_12520 [Geminicoccaceae bacterium]
MNQKKRQEQAEGWDPRGPSRIFRAASGHLARGAVALLVASGIAFAAAQDLPRTDEELVDVIRTAIDARDYEPFEQLVNWEGAGKIKRRIVRFEIRRGFGRKIDTIAIENFPKDGMAKIDAMKQVRVNMPVTHRVRVTFDEPPLEKTGRQPTSVFLVGKQDGAYRIALVVRNFDDDDD